MQDDDKQALPPLPETGRQDGPVAKSVGPVDRDWFLLEFIRLAELGVEQGITLSVGGSLVTGTIISGSKFFDLLSDEIDRAKATATGDTLIYDNIKHNYQIFKDWVANTKDDPEQPVPIRNYVHLRDARVVFGNGSVPSAGGVLWRGRVQAVDAFFSGSVGTA